MTIPAWPDSNVPSTARDGWQMSEMYVAPIATDFDGGNQRLRSRPGSNVAIISYPLQPLTLTQWGYLDTFIRTTLGNGASRFTMSLVIGGASVSKTVQLDGGKSPQVTQEGQVMHVTLPLRVFGL
jgi:hypothetical protein